MRCCIYKCDMCKVLFVYVRERVFCWDSYNIRHKFTENKFIMYDDNKVMLNKSCNEVMMDRHVYDLG